MKDKRIWIIFLIIFVNLLGFGIILPLLPYYVESFGAGPLTIGLIFASYSFFQIISAPILGELSDKFGRRPVLLFSIFGTAVSFGLLGIANSIPLLFLSRIIDGATGGNISTAQAYIADITTKENRTQGMGIMMAAFSLGFIIGPALGGLLSVYGYAVPAFVAGIVALGATLLTYFFLPESLKRDANSIKVKGKRRPIFSVKDFYDALTHPEVGLMLSISFMTMFAFSLMQGTFALFTEHSLSLTAQTNGFIFAYLGFIGIIVQVFLLKRILKLLPEHRIVTIAIASLAVSLALIALSTNLIMLVIAITILAIANGVSGPVIAGYISKLTPDNEQGNIAGMNQSVGGVARLFGPLLGTFFYSQIGMRSPYFIATGILLLTCIYGIKKLKPVKEVVTPM
ncbi:MFS transporter [Candidatus Woesebacteria bacterium]|nr:MAG: MFS transporter [Candidatus Woesebacteria bacterium]